MIWFVLISVCLIFSIVIGIIVHQNRVKLDKFKENFEEERRKAEEAINESKEKESKEDKSENKPTMRDDLSQTAVSLQSQITSLTAELNELIEIHRKTMLQNALESNPSMSSCTTLLGDSLSLTPNEKSLIAAVSSICQSYPSYTAEFATIVWKAVVLKRAQALVKRIGATNKGGIYRIWVIEKGERQLSYVGRTSSFSTRWYDHLKKGLSCYFGETNAERLYLWEGEGLSVMNWHFEILDDRNNGEAERYWIRWFASDEVGFNSNCGG